MSTSTQTQTHTSSSPPNKIDTIKNSAAYLMYGSAAGASAVPASWKTRSMLTTARYVSKYIFWRLIRYAKYAVAGAVATALGGTLLATLTSGAAMFAAPSFISATALGTGWAVVKFAYNHRPTAIRQIQSRIENMLHLSPSPTLSSSSAVGINSSSTTATTTTTDSGSWMDRIRKRALRGSDAKDDEQLDHST